MTRFITTALVVLATLAAHTQTRGNTPDARAARAYENSEWASAAALYSIAADRNPSCTRAYVRSSISYAVRGDTSEAVSAIERALANAVPLDSLLDGLRVEAFALKMPAMYTMLLDRAGDTMPWLRRPLDLHLMHYADRRHDPDGMERYARRMLAGLPADSTARSILARAHTMQGQLDQAEAEWLRHIGHHPADHTAMIELGNLYVAKGDKDRALHFLERARQIRPTPYVEILIQRLRATQ